jgi:CRISPR/Cas system Type II protein with McrA/HNH and RuvC-like nuclease domain
MSYGSDASRIRFWEDQEKECPLCELPIIDPLNRNRLDPEACNIDHKIPTSHGGSDARSNLQLTHIPCNQAKGCGCPPGDVFHVNGLLPQKVWREQNFRCALCREPITPSGINDTKQVKLIDDGLSHVSCIKNTRRQRDP